MVIRVYRVIGFTGDVRWGMEVMLPLCVFESFARELELLHSFSGELSLRLSKSEPVVCLKCLLLVCMEPV